jgi:hypothetical protein
MIAFLAALVSVILSLVTPTTVGEAQPTGVYVIGDSITAGAAEYLPGWWHVDAEPGRNVDLLPEHLKLILAQNPSPRTVVVALGTNAVRGWSKQDYADAIGLLPAFTTVVFVTTYRNPDYWGGVEDFRRQPWVQYHYSKWMNELTTERPNTCRVAWRYRVKHHPGALYDGVHPRQTGRERWVDMVRLAVRDC